METTEKLLPITNGLPSNEKQEKVEKKISKNEWYALFETRIDKDTSVFRLELFKTDAQLGISIAGDIARIAKTRGFAFMSFNPDDIELITVNFHTAKPDEKDDDEVLDVDSMIAITSNQELDNNRDEIKLTPQEKSLLSKYEGDVVLPNSLVRTYSQFAEATKTPTVQKLKTFILPYGVNITTAVRNKKYAEYSPDMNVAFLKTRFRKQILNLRKESEHCYLIRTNSSYIRFVKTAANEWKIYAYGDKPIQ